MPATASSTPRTATALTRGGSPGSPSAVAIRSRWAEPVAMSSSAAPSSSRPRDVSAVSRNVTAPWAPCGSRRRATRPTAGRVAVSNATTRVARSRPPARAVAPATAASSRTWCGTRAWAPGPSSVSSRQTIAAPSVTACSDRVNGDATKEQTVSCRPPPGTQAVSRSAPPAASATTAAPAATSPASATTSWTRRVPRRSTSAPRGGTTASTSRMTRAAATGAAIGATASQSRAWTPGSPVTGALRCGHRAGRGPRAP